MAMLVLESVPYGSHQSFCGPVVKEILALITNAWWWLTVLTAGG